MRILTIMTLLLSLQMRAQIVINNPDLDGTGCWSGCSPYNWGLCDYLVSVVDSQFDSYIVNKGSYSSINYVVFESEPSINDFGSINQVLNCELEAGKEYLLKFYSKSVYWNINGYENRKGYIEVFLSSDTCSNYYRVYKSQIVDTAWALNAFIFTPPISYQEIVIKPTYDTILYNSPFYCDMAVDAFSPIYLLNAHAVDIVQADTVLEQSGQVYIEATPSIGSINSVFWIRVHNGGIDTVARQTYRYTATQSGTYIVAARDSIVGCAGVEWSFDTVRVSMPTGLDEIEDNNFYFYLYPNPKDANQDIVYIQNSEKGTLRLYNNVGQLVHSATLMPLFNEIQLSHLSAGVYTYKVVFDSGKVQANKLVIR